MKNIVFVVLGIAFLFYGIVAYKSSVPERKNKRIYQAIKKYSPYYLEKRFGGLEILSKENNEFKEKPSNMEVFHRLDQLEKEWGKAHLTMQNSTLIVHDKNGTHLGTIILKTADEKAFVHNFYGL